MAERENREILQKVVNHTHNGVDSPLITGSSIVGTPLAALTAQAGNLSTGGAAVLSTNDSDTIINTIDRLTELETKLRSIGIIL